MMMRSLCVSLTMLAVVASLATATYAGGGAGEGVTVTLLNCYSIQNGPDSPYTLSVNDEFGVQQHIRLGKAQLACKFSTPGPFVKADGSSIDNQGAVVERGPTLTAIDQNAAIQFNCYGVIPSGSKVNSLQTVIDPFSGAAGERIAVSRLSMVCAPGVPPVAP